MSDIMVDTVIGGTTSRRINGEAYAQSPRERQIDAVREATVVLANAEARAAKAKDAMKMAERALEAAKAAKEDAEVKLEQAKV